MAHPLAALFSPRSVAVLGVSRDPAKLGYRLLQNVKEHGFAGPVYPVNPSGDAILGSPTIRDVAALPDDVDLALVSLPAPAVPGAITALAERGVRAAVVLSSGFGEVDEAGRGAQADVLARARARGLRLVGPNCMGVYSAAARLNGTYFWDLPRLPGGIGLVSQSGAYGGLIFRYLGGRGLGISRFLSIGNQADVDVADVVEYLADDPETRVIACFVEALRDGRRFVDVAARARDRKPVVVLKGGRSDAGRRAAGSHTGSLAGTYDVYRAGFRRAGVVLAEETEDFFDAIEALSVVGDRRPRAPRIAILTVSGGPSVVAADAAERAGLGVPALPLTVRAGLRALLPPFAAVGNPVDLTPHVDPANIAAAVRIVMNDGAVAGAVAVNVGLDFPAFADAIVDAARDTGKPVVAFTADAPRITERFRASGIPVLPSPERAVRGWRALWEARFDRHGGERRPLLAHARELSIDARLASGCASPSAPPPGRLRRLTAEAIAKGPGPLPYLIARRLLEAYGVAFCREVVVGTADAAVAAANGIGYPVVVKADVPGLVHKTEAAAVRLGLRDESAVRESVRELQTRLGASTLVVQEQIGPGVELLVGGRRDASFGPLVALGTGGVLTEVIRDVSLRLAPVTDEEASEMLREGVRERLLAGPRGLLAVEPAPLLALVRAVGDLLVAEPRIVEIDVNPVIAAGARAVAVDAVVIVGESAAGGYDAA